MHPREQFLFYFARPDIEPCITESSHQAFPEGRLSPRMLQRMDGAVKFSICGYQEQSQELFLIPAVRRFFRVLIHETDYGVMFFSELTSSFVAGLANCHIADGAACSGSATYPVHVANAHWRAPHFTLQGLRAIGRLSRQAELPDRDTSRRKRQFLVYMRDEALS